MLLALELPKEEAKTPRTGKQTSQQPTAVRTCKNPDKRAREVASQPLESGGTELTNTRRPNPVLTVRVPPLAGETLKMNAQEENERTRYRPNCYESPQMRLVNSMTRKEVSTAAAPPPTLAQGTMPKHPEPKNSRASDRLR